MSTSTRPEQSTGARVRSRRRPERPPMTVPAVQVSEGKGLWEPAAGEQGAGAFRKYPCSPPRTLVRRGGYCKPESLGGTVMVFVLAALLVLNSLGRRISVHLL